MEQSAAIINRRLLEAMSAFGIGAVTTFAVLALSLDRPLMTLSGVAYSISLLVSCLCSLLYGINRHRPLRQLLRLLDHSAIFLLIAGTYTPFVISGIAGPFGISLLVWVWAMAAVGIGLKLLLRERHEQFFVLFYLAFGWLFLSALPVLVSQTPGLAFGLLAAGGVAFSCGAVIYWRARGHWADVIWHGFVFAGISLHFLAVLTLILAIPV
ncbi:MAG TPA: hemolysin III family protein [Dongiaceae bacterium]|nr:hemolysin III family protein [Dongiaceae bacterium]